MFQPPFFNMWRCVLQVMPSRAQTQNCAVHLYRSSEKLQLQKFDLFFLSLPFFQKRNVRKAKAGLFADKPGGGFIAILVEAQAHSLSVRHVFAASEPVS